MTLSSLGQPTTIALYEWGCSSRNVVRLWNYLFTMLII